MNRNRHIPSIDQLVSASHVREHVPHALIVAHARQLCADLRASTEPIPALSELVTRLDARITQLLTSSQRPVINATGVLLQTNLGRAPLSIAAQQAMQANAAASSIEYDLDAGRRGERNRHLAPLLCHITGAEAALVVNNNAAAILLILAAHAVGREVIVSRGQAVEIGGGFRIPDVLRQSGATLVEVGTTNRTYAHDYARAITAQTAMLLTVHTSNFRLQGFVHEPTMGELSAVAHEHGILHVDDVGSGTLIDVAQYGLTAEPLVQSRVSAGVDLVCFSGDKLLGGPQAGIIVGRAAAIRALAVHPLMRAFRIDKMTMAALHATLLSYAQGTATHDIPIWQMIGADAEQLHQRAQQLYQRLGDPWRVRPCDSTVGGGSLPGDTQPSWALTYAHPHPEHITTLLRQQTPAIVARIAADAVWLDLRSILPSDDTRLGDILMALTPQLRRELPA
jgi:L-seryl-tRNA(Ser) seleniumtransferase